MPRHLKLIARFANSGLIILFAVVVLGLLAKGKIGGAFLGLCFTTLLCFNLYLIEKAATLLSEEEWLKGEIRKVLLRRKLARLAKGETAETVSEESERGLP